MKNPERSQFIPANELQKKTLSLEQSMVRYRDLLSVPVKETGERFVSLNDLIPNGYKPEMADMETLIGPDVIVRESVAQRLLNAQRLLQQIDPSKTLFVTYGYRDLGVQTKRFLGVLQNVAKEFFPDPANLYEEAHRFVAVPTVAGHPTGGAVDIVIRDKQTNAEINFGGKQYNYETKNCYVFYPDIDQEAKTNRMLLRDVMTQSGFAPFDGEWWHFSFGDREWAYFYKMPAALYEQQNLSALARN